MGDLFDIGKAGISAYKNSLAATGQNIANVGTEGYSRRDASIEEISSAKADVLSLSNSAGLGVRMGGITRAFDQFLDLQLQNSSSSFSFSSSFIHFHRCIAFSQSLDIRYFPSCEKSTEVT